MNCSALQEQTEGSEPSTNQVSLFYYCVPTYSANYALGGGVTLGAVYFDVEQTANSVTRTDVDGLMTKLSVGF